MSFTIDGIDELLHDIQAMAAAVGEDGRVQTNTLKSAAEPIHRQMKANASSDPNIITGALHGSIRIGKVKKHGTGKRITIGVHHSEMSAYYSNPVEFGHAGPAPAPAHPFVRPAFDTTKDEAYEIIKEELRAALRRKGG